jgi:CheY-like chemotaxis protein
MATTTDPKTILLLDDELFNIYWLIDYINSQGYDVYPTASADEAIQAISSEIYRAAIIDLNVPMASAPSSGPRNKNPVYQRYPGLYVAWFASNRGYRDRQVIIYSVHRDEEVAREAKIIGCTYIVKGRPRELKDELIHVLSHDPTRTEDGSLP